MRLWEIRESDGESSRFGRRGYKMGMRGYRDSESKEAYECGYEDGYRDAMKEAKEYYEDKESHKKGYREY